MGFDKMFVFCGKFCVYSDKRVSIVVKIKCVNFDNISDICDKLNLTTYILQQLTNILSKHTQILQLLTHSAGPT